MSYNKDFYNFVNQEWLDNNEIPKGYSRWGTFNEIDKENKDKLLSLITDISKTDEEGMKVKILYDQYLNRKYKLSDVMGEVDSFLSEIRKFESKKELNKFICQKFYTNGIATPLLFSVDTDLDDSSINILHISSGGLGLPDRDYYFDKNHRNILNEYKLFMEKYLNKFGNFDFNNILLIEEKLAECSYTKVEKRNPHLMNNKYDLDVIDCNFKKFYIKDILSLLNLSPHGKINITNPKLIRRYYELWNCITIKNWIDFYSWIYLRNIGQLLCKETDKIIFNFYSGVLNGVYDMKPDEERAVDFVDSQIGMILSKIYVKKYFPDEKRKMVIDLVNSIKITFKKRLENNQWMSKETKLKALEKLEKMNFKIVSPNEGEWRNYNNLIIDNNLLLIQNVMNIKEFEESYEFSYLNKPVDKTQWFMNPHDVNAYYSPNYNEIVFPAGILQGDFFGDNMIKNFGGIGVVIGHEITHGFDDEGRKFDSDGNLNNWFTEADIKSFESKSIKLEKQFDNLSIEGMRLNGKLTLGENIADLGGVVISYNAMEEYMKDKDMTDEDRKTFFTSFAKIWKSKATPESIKLRVATDPHSPPIYRVNQILGNFEPFLDLYNISENDDMYIDENERADIW
tara:strand:+ start:1140 stop:3011 length:1872 start_codon:yes stop_codon:yes gene_type:complete